MSRIRRSGRFCWLQRQSGGRLLATDTNGTGASEGCKKGEKKKKKRRAKMVRGRKKSRARISFSATNPLPLPAVCPTLFTYFYGLFLLMDHKLSNRQVLDFFSVSLILFSPTSILTPASMVLSRAVTIQPSSIPSCNRIK